MQTYTVLRLLNCSCVCDCSEIWNQFLEFESTVGDLASTMKVEKRRSQVLAKVNRTRGSSSMFGSSCIMLSHGIYSPQFCVKFCDAIKVGLYGIRPVRILRRSSPAVMLSPAVAMTAGVHCQRLADYLHDTSCWLVITRRYTLC